MRYLICTILFLLIFSSKLKSQPGILGAGNINAAGVIVNTYAFLTANATAGTSTLTVNNNAMTGGAFGGALAAGDLILIIQMQGATIDTRDSSIYGAITNYNNCGLYEYRCVTSTSGSNSITVSVPLTNNYTATGKVQVIRVPRYSSIRIRNNSSITAPDWNGQTGGIIVLEVNGNFRMDNATTSVINADGIGFRGGANDNTTQPAGSVITTFRSTNVADGGRKGEGIAGGDADYDTMGGRYGRGAPANGGGGGNSHNAGGGGGANAGVLAAWNGQGNPDTSGTSWSAAWNLESANFALNTSSGGGRGGYTYSHTNRDAITEGPGLAVWTGNSRRNLGGYGGRPLDYSTGRVFMGGGGGAGDGNNSAASGGAKGGGMIFILHYGNFTGSGTLISNGMNSPSTSAGHNDAPGGGGGGGTIIFSSLSNIPNTFTFRANGGLGGNQLITNNEAEGPGGGGGGGYIAISSGTPNREALGGANGTTTSAALTEFIPNGATRGGEGVPNSTFSPLLLFDTITADAGPDLIFCMSTFLQAVQPMPNSIGSWRIIAGVGGSLSDINDPNATFSGDTLTAYTLEWTVINNLCQIMIDTMELTPDCLMMPVSLYYFKGNRSNRNIDIAWATTRELNNANFTIFRSTDKNNWIQIGTIEGKGNAEQISSYQFVDFEAPTQTVFYRLIKTDFDGNTENLGEIKVNGTESLTSFLVYPNPVSSSLFIKGFILSYSEYLIYNSLGQIVKRGFTEVGNHNSIELEGLLSGTYYLTIVSKGEIIFKTRFVKTDIE